MGLLPRSLSSGIHRGMSGTPLPPFAFTPPTYDGPSNEQVHQMRTQFHGPLVTFYKKPVMIVEGKQQYLFDETGRRYLDMFAGIVTVSVGHCHPKVTKAVTDQMQRLQHTTNIYLNPQIALYSQELMAKFADVENLKDGTVFFTNSGSEANDLAMVLARIYTGSFDILALRNCYHGMSAHTMGVTALSTWKYSLPQGFGIHHVACPHSFRSAVPKNMAADFYAAELASAIQFSTSGRVAAFIAESIQGVGGAVTFPPGYLQQAYHIVRSHGGLCIADEVQTGFGRMGSEFWGFQSHGVEPDIVTMAKGIANGFPMGAVVAKKEVMERVNDKLFFNTYGGNPMACAAGRAVLEVIEEEGLQANCAHVGGYLKGRLAGLKDQYELVGDVRGRGLMLGVELVKDRETKEPAKAETNEVFESLRESGILVGKGGLHGNVLRIKPPMCITMEDAEFFAHSLEQALKKI